MAVAELTPGHNAQSSQIQRNITGYGQAQRRHRRFFAKQTT